jgi:S-adenosylmethionine/arginine decarboxylase-like enzyme
MCGAARPQLALDAIEQALRPSSRQVRAVARGLA